MTRRLGLFSLRSQVISQLTWKLQAESRRDQEEGGELDSHVNVNRFGLAVRR